MGIVYFVAVDAPRGECHVFDLDSERLNDDGIWQDLGDVEGPFASQADAEQREAELRAHFDSVQLI